MNFDLSDWDEYLPVPKRETQDDAAESVLREEGQRAADDLERWKRGGPDCG